MTILFDSVLTDKIKLKPIQLGKNMKDILLYHIQKKFQGTCSQHGYILENSISIIKYSAGKIIDLSLNGDIEYLVTYKGVVCNPVIGSVIDAKVINKNKFGLLAKTELTYNKMKYDILEIIVPDHICTFVADYEIGNNCKIEILGKKFELNDKKISVIGKITREEKVNTTSKKSSNDELLRAPSIQSDSDSVILDDETEDEKSDNDEETEDKEEAEDAEEVEVEEVEEVEEIDSVIDKESVALEDDVDVDDVDDIESEISDVGDEY